MAERLARLENADLRALLQRPRRDWFGLFVAVMLFLAVVSTVTVASWVVR
jgi:hypothetical protein